MAFDDQLKRAFDTLTDRLRDEINRQVQAAMDELSASARQEAESAAAAAVAALPPPPPPEARKPELDADGYDAAIVRLLEGIRAIDRARSLTDVLAALVDVASQGGGGGVWLLRGDQLRRWRSSGVDAPTDISLDDPHPIAEAVRANAPVARDGFAVPLALSGQVVAVLFVGSSQAPAASIHATEVVARYAARSLEAITAFKAARAMADRAASESDKTQSPGESSSGAASNATHGEDHVAAQRYARLLVSEIKLYHEQAVVEGRRDRNLATRLGGEIARARVMYEQRVPPHVRERADHFHDELVRTLADGDASLLTKTQDTRHETQDKTDDTRRRAQDAAT